MKISLTFIRLFETLKNCVTCVLEMNYVVQSSPQLCSKRFPPVRVVTCSVVAKYAFELHVKTRAFLYVKCMLHVLNKKKKNWTHCFKIYQIRISRSFSGSPFATCNKKDRQIFLSYYMNFEIFRWLSKSPYSLIGMTTRLWAGRSGVWMPVATWDSSLFQNILTAAYSTIIEAPLPLVSGWGIGLTTSRNPEWRLKMSDAAQTIPLPLTLP